MNNYKTLRTLTAVCFAVISILMIGNLFDRLTSDPDLSALMTLLQFVGNVTITVATVTSKRKTVATGAVLAGIGAFGRSFGMLSIYADIAGISMWKTFQILSQRGLLADILFFDFMAEGVAYFMLAVLCGSRKQIRWPGFLAAALFAIAPLLLLSGSGFPYNGTGTVSYLCRIAGAILYTLSVADETVSSVSTATLHAPDAAESMKSSLTAQTIEEIEKYRVLLEQGILTEDEFEQKRRAILHL